MIFITGDIHGMPRRLGSRNFPLGKTLTKDDYVIILGDFGLVWNYRGESSKEKYWLDWLDNKPWTTLFIDGNHENFDRLNTYPKEEWHGGLVQKIRPSVIHLCRGEVFNIEDRTFLAMGGASSHDIKNGIIDPANYKSKKELKKGCRKLEKECGGWRFALYRIKGISWWESELPNQEDKNNAIINLNKVGNKVDYILTHELPFSSLVSYSQGFYVPSDYNIWLENEIRSKVEYRKWFCGHYHENENITTKDILLYDEIYELERKIFF